MDTDRARRAHSIFTAALDLPRAEREAMLADACHGDDALSTRVRKLLAASERTGGFLETPALAELSRENSPIPESIGDFAVVGVLGEGGMATVYEAVQRNPSRRVALKLMHAGLTSTDALLRFRLETQTLAHLHHPGIAQIFEAGTAAIGRHAPAPFFAMELIKDALPFTEYARRHALPLRDRLLMFASLCDAVLHGHQNGVIHRDLKPANVLVGANGLAKVIDFGIARTTQAAPAGATSLTLHADKARLLGTLNYMSPEQCEHPETVDVRTDVYSLGVMLYELITDRLPHQLNAKSLPEAVRTIVHDDPPRASSLCPAARGDLDAILATAMHKDRALRYPGADALAADIRRWLSDLPIQARPASPLEHARKFVRRNRALSAAIAALALTLVTATVVGSWLAYSAAKARDQALQREQELAIASDFQESLLRDLDVAAMGDQLRSSFLESLRAAAASEDPAAPAALPPDSLDAATRLAGRVNFTSLAITSLNQSILQRYALSIDAKFADQPSLRARLQQQLASTMNNLGLYAQAEPLLRSALEARRAALGEDHEDTLLTLHSLGSLLTTLERYDEALPLLREAHQRRAATLGPDHPATLRTGASLGGLHMARGDLAEAERIRSEVLAAQRRTLGDDDRDTLRSLSNMGVVYAAQGKFAQAEACWRELLDRRLRTLGPDHPEYVGSLGNLGALLQDQGRLDEARPLIEQALAADRRSWGDIHKNTLVSMAQLASLVQDQGDLPRAESLWRECYAGRVQTLGPETQTTLRTQVSLAYALHLRGNNAEAISLLTRANEAQARTLGPDHQDTLDSAKLLTTLSGAP